MTAGAKGLDAGMGMGTTLDDITATTGNGGVDLTNTTGTTTFASEPNTRAHDHVLVDGGVPPSSAGTASGPSGGTANVSATAGRRWTSPARPHRRLLVRRRRLDQQRG